MIIYEKGQNFTKIYSDLNVYIHGGDPQGNYQIAIELNEMIPLRTYIQTNMPIPPEEEEKEIREEENNG